MACSYENCGFACYESHDECIFHCQKDDWFTPVEKRWKKGKVAEFWKAIRDRINKINNQYIGFIFPAFEEYQCEFTFSDNLHLRAVPQN